jgi:GT2 family glycosyltransferase
MQAAREHPQAPRGGMAAIRRRLPAAAVALGPMLDDGPGLASRALTGLALEGLCGRWLRLRFALPQPHRVTLRLQGRSGRWPCVDLPLVPRQGWADVLVFLSPGVQALRLHAAQPAALAATSLEGHELLPAGPAADAAVAASQHTAARLSAWGVSELRQIELTDDPRWPLRATGDDPQLRFARRPRGPGRLHLALATEHADAGAPVAYLPDGAGGYHPARTVAAPLQPEDPSAPPAAAVARAWHTALPAPREAGRWRLDPMDRPGRLRIDTLAVAAEGGDRWLALWRTACAALRPLRWRFGAGDCRAASGLQPLGGATWRAHTDDPQWWLSGRAPAGWYMLELSLLFDSARGHAQLYANLGEGWNEQHVFDLPLRSGRLAKRLVWLPDSARLRLDPLRRAGDFELQHFSLQRVSRGFARERLHRKLCTARGGQPSAEQGRAGLPVLWDSYGRLFKPTSEGVVSYDDWMRDVEAPSLPCAAEQAAAAAEWSWRPRVSIVMPVYNPDPAWLAAAIDSVCEQGYPHWQLCIADDASTDPRIAPLLAARAAGDARIRLVRRVANGGISAASQDALDLAGGDFVALLDHDDQLAPHALFAVAKALQQRPAAQIVYSDEDKLDAHGRRCHPFFKPDWSPELLRAQNYVSHLGVYRRALLQAVGGFRAGFDGSQDYDLLLRCVARVADPADIVHLPQVLYHWRMAEGSTAAGHDAKPQATEAARRALQEAAEREAGQGPVPRVSVVAPGVYRHRWQLPDPAPRVSLIVPTRDGLDVLRQCVDSLLAHTTYRPLELLVVDNQSREPQTLHYLAALPALAAQHGVDARVLPFDAPFNFSAINNHAAAQARGSVLGLLNNDIEVMHGDWLHEMVSHALRPGIGCVGAKLHYPDGTLQHAGVVLGIGGVAGHSHKYFPSDAEGYFSRLRTVHDVSAVTAACLLVRKAIYDEVGGLDADDLHVAFNDVDFCIKVREAGHRNLFTPYAELRHHESKTRGADTTPEKQARFQHEAETMRRRWGALLDADPFYSPHLSRTREDYSIAAPAPRPPMAAMRRPHDFTA